MSIFFGGCRPCEELTTTGHGHIFTEKISSLKIISIIILFFPAKRVMRNVNMWPFGQLSGQIDPKRT